MDKNFLESLKTGYIDKSIESDISIVPEIITNDFNKPQKVLTSIINSLSTCDYFFFNVAFLTKSGVIALFNTLEEMTEPRLRFKKIFHCIPYKPGLAIVW